MEGDGMEGGDDRPTTIDMFVKRFRTAPPRKREDRQPPPVREFWWLKNDKSSSAVEGEATPKSQDDVAQPDERDKEEDGDLMTPWTSPAGKESRADSLPAEPDELQSTIDPGSGRSDSISDSEVAVDHATPVAASPPSAASQGESPHRPVVKPLHGDTVGDSTFSPRGVRDRGLNPDRVLKRARRRLGLSPADMAAVHSPREGNGSALSDGGEEVIRRARRRLGLGTIPKSYSYDTYSPGTPPPVVAGVNRLPPTPDAQQRSDARQLPASFPASDSDTLAQSVSAPEMGKASQLLPAEESEQRYDRMIHDVVSTWLFTNSQGGERSNSLLGALGNSRAHPPARESMLNVESGTFSRPSPKRNRDEAPADVQDLDRDQATLRAADPIVAEVQGEGANHQYHALKKFAAMDLAVGGPSPRVHREPESSSNASYSVLVSPPRKRTPVAVAPLSTPPGRRRAHVAPKPPSQTVAAPPVAVTAAEGQTLQKEMADASTQALLRRKRELEEFLMHLDLQP